MSTQLPWDRFGEPSEELPPPVIVPEPPPPFEEELPYVPPPRPPGPPAPPVTPEPEPPPQIEVVEIGAGGGGSGGVSPRPAPVEDINLAHLANQAFTVALSEALPGLKQNAMDLLQASIKATVAGKEVDWSHPQVTAVTDRGRELVVADAKSRSWRTLLQGLAIDLFFALIVLLGTLTEHDVMDAATWTVFFALLIKTVIQTTVSYFMRLKITPTIKENGEKYNLLPVPSPIPQQTPLDRAA